MTFIEKYFHFEESKKASVRKVLLIDRDNTINFDNGYTFLVSQMKIIEEAINVIKLATSKSIPTVVITNQSLIAKKLATLEEVNNFNGLLVSELEKKNCKIDAIFLCPHQAQDKCRCRKPAINMFLKCFEMYPNSSFCYLGDQESDRLAALNVGIEFFDSSSKQGYRLTEEWLKK